MLMRLFLQVGFLTTFAILLHEIPHEVRLQNTWLNLRILIPYLKVQGITLKFPVFVAKSMKEESDR